MAYDKVTYKKTVLKESSKNMANNVLVRQEFFNMRKVNPVNRFNENGVSIDAKLIIKNAKKVKFLATSKKGKYVLVAPTKQDQKTIDKLEKVLKNINIPNLYSATNDYNIYDDDLKTPKEFDREFTDEEVNDIIKKRELLEQNSNTNSDNNANNNNVNYNNNNANNNNVNYNNNNVNGNNGNYNSASKNNVNYNNNLNNGDINLNVQNNIKNGGNNYQKNGDNNNLANGGNNYQGDDNYQENIDIENGGYVEPIITELIENDAFKNDDGTKILYNKEDEFVEYENDENVKKDLASVDEDLAKVEEILDGDMPKNKISPKSKKKILNKSSAEDIKNGKKLAWLSYILFFIPLLFNNKNTYIKFHANEGLKVDICIILSVGLFLVGNFVKIGNLYGQGILLAIQLISVVIFCIAIFTKLVMMIVSFYGIEFSIPWLLKFTIIK